MVRLKFDGGVCGVVVVGFQFHYGSIKIGAKIYHSYTVIVFQFHYGSIKMGFRGRRGARA